MGLNDLGRKGKRLVLVTKKEGEPPLNEVDTYIGVCHDSKAQDTPLTVEMPKPRPPSDDGRLVMRYTPPTSVGVVSGTGIDTRNLASDK